MTECSAGTVQVGLFLLPLLGRLRLMMFSALFSILITCLMLFLDISTIALMFPFNWGKIVSPFFKLWNSELRHSALTGRATRTIQLWFIVFCFLFSLHILLAIAIVERRRIRIYICVLDYYFWYRPHWYCTWFCLPKHLYGCPSIRKTHYLYRRWVSILWRIIKHKLAELLRQFPQLSILILSMRQIRIN